MKQHALMLWKGTVGISTDKNIGKVKINVIKSVLKT